MIIAVTNLKGGVGKSTISRTLAVFFAQNGIKTCIVDTDLEQRTSTDWCTRRPETAVYVPVFPMTAIQNLSRDIKTHLDNGYQIVIIDGVPQLSESATKTIAIADLLIIPLEPSFDDILSFEKFIDRFNQVKMMREVIPAYTVMNRFSGRNLEDVESRETLAVFEEHGIKPMNSFLENRVAYKRQTKYGLTVLDAGADEKIEKEVKKARTEALNFCKEVEKIMVDILKS
jgi:chromosome partitioning protein